MGSTLIAGYKEIKEGDEVFSLTMLLASKELVPQTQVGTLEMHLFSKYFALTPHTSRKHALFLHKLKQKEADANDGSPAAQLFVRLTNQYGLRNPLGETESTNATSSDLDNSFILAFERVHNLADTGLSKPGEGDSDAQFMVAKMWEEGIGVKQDIEKAVYYYTKAATQGHSVAQCILGLCYDEGKGVGLDQKRAVELFELSANQGNYAAQLSLYGKSVV